MEFAKFLEFVKENYKTILISALIGAGFGLILSAFACILGSGS